MTRNKNSLGEPMTEEERAAAEAAANKAKRRKKRKIKRAIMFTLLVLIGIGCIGVILYPMISNLYSDQMQSKVHTAYEKKLDAVDNSALDYQFDIAQQYNRELDRGLSYEENRLAMDTKAYESMLDPTGTGIMAYVDIPIIDVYLPIYHGTALANLDKGVVHLLGTSLPVGGESTHCALSAHTGLSSNKLFTDLESVKVGDVFYLHVMKQTLAYQVVRVDVVEPYDTSLLEIVPGEDLVTLITCTPYGINSHRLLVRGSRIPYQEAVEIEKVQEEERPQVESQWELMYLQGIKIGLIAAGSLIIIVIIICLIRKKLKKRRKQQEMLRKRNEEKE